MDPLAPLITALHSQGRLRVWSMVISVFGDLVQHRGGQISTTRLGAVLGRVGVEQGALRTALSRLGRDDWVQSDRIGRASHYRLSAKGLDRFATATQRIYAPPRTAPVSRWAMAITLGPSGKQEIALRPEDEIIDPCDCLVVGSLQTLSSAYRATQLGEDHRIALEALAADIDALDGIELADPLDGAAARVLLIHRWRRIVLRFAEVPSEMMPPDAPLPNPRQAVATAYARLSPSAETWLSGDLMAEPAMPKADGNALDRFKAT